MTGVEGRTDGTGAFADALEALDERGAAFLVVGDVPLDVHGEACERLLGSSDGSEFLRVQTRERPLVDDSRGRTIAFDASVRSAAASGGPTPSARTVATSLSELGAAAVDELTRLDATSDASLRVCVESLTPLRAACDDETVFRFLHLLAGRARKSGRLHVHLSAPAGSADVALYRDLFDGLVELRVAEDGIQQRWHLHDADVSSAWLALE
jgi:predicted signal transduction protein with EAL and GGDEF domain